MNNSVILREILNKISDMSIKIDNIEKDVTPFYISNADFI